MSQSLSIRAMSFDLTKHMKYMVVNMSLNPFRAGRCLSTTTAGQGGFVTLSQSLSIRAMSFDGQVWDEYGTY